MFADIENNDHLKALANQTSFEERCESEQVFLITLADAEDA